MNKIFKIIGWWGAVLLWMGVIYYFSAQPGLKSELEPMWDMIFRKIAHMAEFFILAYFFFQAYRSLGVNKGRSLLFAFLFSIIYAGFDEWHQTQVVDRTGTIKDVLIDSLGVIFFTILKVKQRS